MCSKSIHLFKTGLNRSERLPNIIVDGTEVEGEHEVLIEVEDAKRRGPIALT